MTPDKAIHLLLIAAVPLLFTACADGSDGSDGINKNETTQITESNMNGEDWFDFKEWDADNSGALEKDEFYDNTFGVFDADNDNLISEAEWSENKRIFEGNDFAFDEWDLNGDGFLDAQEFESGLTDAGVFDEWDADNNDLLEEGELNTIFEPGT